jgi:6-phosphogluconolactonase
MQHKLEILQDPAEVVARAADIFMTLATAPESRQVFRVALTGGRTPRSLYTRLVSEPYRSCIVWTRIEFFFADERAVSPDHEASNFRLAHEALFRPLGISPERVHRMQAELEDLSLAARLYASELQSFANGRIPEFDLVLLGMGEDAHVASLFPHHRALHEQTSWVVPVFDAPKPPPRRLTVTVPVLNAAKHVLFIVTGEEKAPALREVMLGSSPPEAYPAKFVRPRNSHVLWLVDHVAGSELRGYSSQSGLLS